MTRTIVLVDGEHQPDVVRAALEHIRAAGMDVGAAVWAGGTEKIGAVPPDLGVPIRGFGSPAGSLAEVLVAAVDEFRPELVFDLSDEPVLGLPERLAVADVLMAAGVPYAGADFRFDPVPRRPIPGGVPALAVVGSGKRTGKTAVAQEVARTAIADGLTPIVVAMGRGGPAVPEVVEAGSVTLERLVELSRAGRHAASDHLEDAYLAGVTTVGSRRAGGGFAGSAVVTNVEEAVAVAAARRPDLLVLEGSGAAAPPLAAGATVLVIPVGSLPTSSDGRSAAGCGRTWWWLPWWTTRLPGLRTILSVPTCAAHSTAPRSSPRSSFPRPPQRSRAGTRSSRRRLRHTQRRFKPRGSRHRAGVGSSDGAPTLPIAGSS